MNIRKYDYSGTNKKYNDINYGSANNKKRIEFKKIKYNKFNDNIFLRYTTTYESIYKWLNDIQYFTKQYGNKISSIYIMKKGPTGSLDYEDIYFKKIYFSYSNFIQNNFAFILPNHLITPKKFKKICNHIMQNIFIQNRIDVDYEILFNCDKYYLISYLDNIIYGNVYMPHTEGNIFRKISDIMLGVQFYGYKYRPKNLAIIKRYIIQYMDIVF